MAILYIILAVIILWVVFAYNTLVRIVNLNKQAFADLDVELKRRYDLIPNLVETVKAYAAHEKAVFERVASARAEALSAEGSGDIGKLARAEGELRGALKTVFAIAENYPDLKASENFQKFQSSLSDTENKIESARMIFNASVRDLNTKIGIFPYSIIARTFNFNKKDFLEFAISRILPIAAFLIFATLPNTSFAREYWYESIKNNISVNQDSTVDVIEYQTFHYIGEYHSGWRSIPLNKIDAITDIAVVDGGTYVPLKYSARRLEKTDPASWGKYTAYRESGAMNIEWYHNLEDTDHLWIIKYKIHGAVGFFKDHDEFYWNIFTDYDAPVNKAEVMVEQIGDATFLKAGGYRNRGSVYDSVTDGRLIFESENFTSREDFTIYASWPKGFVSQSAYWMDFLKIYWEYLLSAVILIGSLVAGFLYWLFKEKLKERGTVAPEFEPPEHLRPAMAEVIVKGKISEKGWAATVVDLAIRGYVKIEEDSVAGIKKYFAPPNYIVKKTKDYENDGTLEDYEKKFLSNILGPGGYFSTKALKKAPNEARRLHNEMESLKQSLYRELETDTATFEVPPEKRQWQKLIFIVLGVVSAGIIVSAADSGSVFGFLLVIFSLAVSAAGLWAFIKFGTRLNEKGIKFKKEWLGFKMYLETAEKQRMQNLAPETFEKYLPYAMIFGVEKKWAHAFESLNIQPPQWYSGGVYAGGGTGNFVDSGGGFSPSAFSSSFSSSFTGAFSSSGGGGSGGGGGGAGGGGGGGGGGAG